jgi:hypothetical protein
MSFAEVLKIHDRLTELFLLHQESLLRLDLELAAERRESISRCFAANSIER